MGTVRRLLGGAALMAASAVFWTSAWAAGAPVSAEELASLSLRLEGERQRLQFRQGAWEGRPAAPGSVTAPRARVHTTLAVRADLNGDGQEDVVVPVTHDPGGSGEFLHLAVVSRQQGRAVVRATRLVGDRVQVRSLRVAAGDVLLDVVRGGPSDPSCCPGELATLAWVLKGNRLVPTDSGGVTGRLGLPVLDGTRWTLARWNPGEPSAAQPPLEITFDSGRASGFSGCNRFRAEVKPGDGPGVLSIGVPAITRMACEEPAMQAETRFLAALAGASGFGFRLGELMLLGREGPMFFAPAR